MTDKLREIARRLGQGIIPRGAAIDVAEAADEMDRLIRGHDEFARVNGEMAAELEGMELQEDGLRAEIASLQEVADELDEWTVSQFGLSYRELRRRRQEAIDHPEKLIPMRQLFDELRVSASPSGGD